MGVYRTGSSSCFEADSRPVNGQVLKELSWCLFLLPFSGSVQLFSFWYFLVSLSMGIIWIRLHLRHLISTVSSEILQSRFPHSHLSSISLPFSPFEELFASILIPFPHFFTLFSSRLPAFASERASSALPAPLRCIDLLPPISHYCKLESLIIHIKIF